MWLGSIVFFSFFIAPALIRVLGAQEGGRAVRALFPRYHAVGIVCGAALAAVSLVRGLAWSWYGMAPLGLGLFAGLTLLAVASRQWLTPAMYRACDAGLPAKPRFDRLHRLSGLVNSLAMMLLLAYVAWMGARGW